MKAYKIHFVCRGNTYRSRLAEALASSLGNHQISVSSSGINAQRDNPGMELSPYAANAAVLNHIYDYLSPHKRQTTQQLLDAADVIVFLNDDVYDDALATYTVNTHKCVAWDIVDISGRGTTSHNNKQALRAVERLETYVKSLVDEIISVSWSDIVDEHDQPAGYRLPVSWANRQGLWRRSCHAVIFTADNKVLIEKRSRQIMFAPGMLDITLGGAVDDGEAPAVAMIREIKEELGLHVNRRQLNELAIYKWSSYHPHYRTFTRSFVYAYYVQLPSTHPRLTIQTSELSEVRLLSASQIDRLLRLHSLSGFGSLSYGYKFYSHIVRHSRQRISSKTVALP